MSKKPQSADTARDTAVRTPHYLEIERTQGDQPGKKEMALTKKPRTSEKEGERTKHFVEIEKGKSV